MLQTASVVYFHLFLYIIWGVTPETRHKRCVKKEKLEKKKTIAMIWLHLDELKKFGKEWGIPSGSWICLRHRNEMNWNHKGSLWPSSWGLHGGIADNWAKYQSRLENFFQTTNMGQSGAPNAKSKQTNKMDEALIINIEERPATSRRQKIFLTLLSVSSSCTS